jgi:hypothetical protein
MPGGGFLGALIAPVVALGATALILHAFVGNGNKCAKCGEPRTRHKERQTKKSASKKRLDD